MFDFFLIPNKSIAGIFWAVILLFIFSYYFRQKKKWEILALVLLTLPISCLLLTSESRAGWLGCITGLFYVAYQHISARQRKKLFIAATLFICLFFLALVFYKSDSSSGRKHIYKISSGILRDNWVSGIGLGKLKSHFNEYQANYFFNHSIDNKTALLADNTFYALNDYLQWGIETGLSGLLFLVFILYLIVRRVLFLQKEYNKKPIITAASSGFICIGTASLFSYPMQIWQLQFLALVFIGIIIFLPLVTDSLSLTKKIVTILIRTTYILLSCFFLFSTISLLKRKRMAKNAFELARAGYRTKAIEEYKKLSSFYPVNGANNLLLAEQLYYSNKLDEALIALQETKKYYVDHKVYKLQAQIENELGKYADAEKSYLRAIYMVPNRMGSRFDLMNFYISRADTLNAVNWANSILKMPVKVPSERSETMLRATKEVLSKLENH